MTGEAFGRQLENEKSKKTAIEKAKESHIYQLKISESDQAGSGTALGDVMERGEPNGLVIRTEEAIPGPTNIPMAADADSEDNQHITLGANTERIEDIAQHVSKCKLCLSKEETVTDQQNFRGNKILPLTWHKEVARRTLGFCKMSQTNEQKLPVPQNLLPYVPCNKNL